MKLSFYARPAVTEKLSEGRPGVGRQKHLNKKKAVVVEVVFNFLPTFLQLGPVQELYDDHSLGLLSYL